MSLILLSLCQSVDVDAVANRIGLDTFIRAAGGGLDFFFYQVGEAVRLVRAAADHERVRQEHFRRMKALRAQLESLEGTKG